MVPRDLVHLDTKKEKISPSGLSNTLKWSPLNETSYAKWLRLDITSTSLRSPGSLQSWVTHLPLRTWRKNIHGTGSELWVCHLCERKPQNTVRFLSLTWQTRETAISCKTLIFSVSSPVYRAWLLYHTLLRFYVHESSSPLCPSAPGSPVKKQPDSFMIVNCLQHLNISVSKLFYNLCKCTFGPWLSSLSFKCF